jgi:hypothetical protein
MGTAWWARLGSRAAWAVAAATAAVLAVAACTSALTPAASSSGHGGGTVSRPGKVITLNRITTLRTLFNHDSGHPRLILIFSPT